MCTIIGATGCKLPQEELAQHFAKTLTRGPDMTKIIQAGSCWLGFQRLAIMDLSPRGMQPFTLNGDYVVCNGELYGFRSIKKKLEGKYPFQSDSDCEILLPLYREYGAQMFPMLGSEFALLLYDHQMDNLIAARDPIGIRPSITEWTVTARRFLPANRRTWWDCAKRSVPSPRALLGPGYVSPVHRFDHRDRIQPRRLGNSLRQHSRLTD